MVRAHYGTCQMVRAHYEFRFKYLIPLTCLKIFVKYGPRSAKLTKNYFLIRQKPMTIMSDDKPTI